MSRFARSSRHPLLRIVVVPLLLAALFFFCHRDHAFGFGWDAYFYLVQIQSWVEAGAMHSSDASLIYPLLRGVYVLIGDYELAYNLLCGLLLGGWFCTMTFVVTAKNEVPSPISFVWLALLTSPMVYFAAQWPKNLLGLLFVGVLWQGLRQRWHWGLLAALLIGCYFGHRMAFVLGCYLWISHLLLHRLSTSHIKRILLLGLLAAGLVLAGSFIPGLINRYEFSRFSGLFQASPHLAPWAFVRLHSWDFFGFFTPLMLLGATAVPVAVLWQCYRQQQWPNRPQTVYLGLMFLLWFPFYRWAPDSMGYRLFHAGLALSPLGLSLIRLPEVRDTTFRTFFVVLFAVILTYAFTTYRPTKHDPPYPRYAEYVAQLRPYLEVPEGPELLIAHKALAEFITFKTGVDVLPWQPEYAVPKDKLWRLVHGVRAQEFRYLLGEQLNEPFAEIGPYLLVRESDWQDFLAALHAEGSNDFLAHLLTWRNPHEERPAYLQKGR